MKKSLIAAAVAGLALANTAQAETTFEKGTFSLGLGFPSAVSDVTLINIGSQAAFSTGNFGFQIDAGMIGYTDFSALESFGTFGVHFHKNAANGNKYGAFLANTYLLNQIGVEAMVGLGAFDIEVSAGIFDEGPGPQNLYNVSANAFYAINDSIEVNAGVEVFLYDGNSETIYEVGGTYKLPNSGVAVNAGYRGIDGESVIEAGVSWSFGPNQDMRMFSERGFDIFFGGLS